jgi:hypothetical protein
MQKELKAAGKLMNVVVINGASAANNQQNLLDVAEMPMLQDTDEVNAWGTLAGGKDDLYLYDAQGKLVQHFPFSGAVDTNLGDDGNYAKFSQLVIDAMAK